LETHVDFVCLFVCLGQAMALEVDEVLFEQKSDYQVKQHEHEHEQSVNVTFITWSLLGKPNHNTRIDE
jgi:hypothetical protein